MTNKNILIAPDSFKGGISSIEFCEIAEEEIKKNMPEACVKSIPMADGGEGTLECIKKAIGGMVKRAEAVDPFGNPISCDILFTDCETAVIETALCCGLPLVAGRENPEITSTRGIGRLIEYAVFNGAKNIILTLGGSCTNDCGAGMLYEMGVVFKDCNGNSFIPTGKNLGKVSSITTSDKFSIYKKISFTAMCDVKNPLYGKTGCSRIFSPQKGADCEMAERLEENVIAFSNIVKNFIGKDFSDYEGAGAAGGLGFACISFLGGTLKSGAETVIKLTKYDEFAKNSFLVITGEGCFDSQSLMGKIVGKIISHSPESDIAVLCGQYKEFDFSKYKNIKYVIPISKGQGLDYAIAHARDNLKEAIRKLIEKY